MTDTQEIVRGLIIHVRKHLLNSTPQFQCTLPDSSDVQLAPAHTIRACSAMRDDRIALQFANSVGTIHIRVREIDDDQWTFYEVHGDTELGNSRFPVFHADKVVGCRWHHMIIHRGSQEVSNEEYWRLITSAGEG